MSIHIPFFLTILLGILWSLVGATVAKARAGKLPVYGFYTCGAFFAFLLSICTGMMTLTPSGLKGSCLIFLLIAGGALMNALSQALTMYNLRGGAKAIIFALSQSSFLFAYLYSILFMGDKTTAYAIIGICILVSAISGAGFLGAKGEDTTLPDIKQLSLGVAASLLNGIGQICMLEAGVRASEGLTAGAKTGLILLFSVFVYGVGAIAERREIRIHWKGVLKYGGIWSIFATLSFATLFTALEKMGVQGRGGLVFPIGCSTCILAFWAISIFKMHDRFSWKQGILLLAIIAGVILLRI